MASASQLCLLYFPLGLVYQEAIEREGYFSNFAEEWLTNKNCIQPSLAWSGWELVRKARGHRFGSRSGHMPELWARSLVGEDAKATDQCFSFTSMFLSLSFSLPSPLSKNTIIFLKIKKIVHISGVRHDVLCFDVCLHCEIITIIH